MRLNLSGIPSSASVSRDGKGVSLLKALTDYVALDLETTGLSPAHDSIIEVAAIRFRNGEEVARYQQLINPGFPIDEFITELTGITDAMLKDAPPIGEVLPEFRAFIGSDVLLGHNVSFDVNFIYDQSAALGFSPFGNDFVDTMRISRRLYPEEEHHRLSDVAAHMKVKIREAHRAMADAELAKVCYEAMCADMAARGITMEDLKPVDNSHRLSETVTAKTDHFDPNTAVYGKTFVFTGELDSMERKAAMQLVVDLGGLCDDTVNKHTNFLVLGNKGYCIALREGKSGKHRKAERMQIKGHDIQIIAEDVFYEMIREASGGEAAQKPESSGVKTLPRAEMPTIPANVDSMDTIDIWYLGDEFRKYGDYDNAFMLFQLAKSKGYDAPAIYESYAKIYRQQKDYQAEIDVLTEAIETLNPVACQCSLARFVERKGKAMELLEKEQQKQAAVLEKEQEKDAKKREREAKQQAAKLQPKQPVGRPILQMAEDMSILRRFDSIADAVRETGVSSKSIRDAANGVQKKAGGFVWRFEDSLQ